VVAALGVAGRGGGGGGGNSRPYSAWCGRDLVTNVSSGMSEMRGPGPLRITATLPRGSKSEDVEAAIYEEIERLKKEPIADWELQKAKNAARRNFINSLQSSLSRAQVLGQYTVYYNEPNLINTRLSKVDAVTKEDVLRVANMYLKQTNRTVVITIPKAGGRNVATGTGNE
jgi:predicted Zn-dependent peptidase